MPAARLNISLRPGWVYWYCMYYHIGTSCDFLFFPKPSLVSLLLDCVCVSVCASESVSLWECLHFKVRVIRTGDLLVGAESERLGWSYYSRSALCNCTLSRKIYGVSQEASVLTSVCGLLFQRGVSSLHHHSLITLQLF